jgi:uncharacterized membrane protein YidH (DUF202 family)
VPVNVFLVGAPILGVFGALEWMVLFVYTYKTFPKLEPHKRFYLAVTNASILTAILLLIVGVSMYLLFSGAFK